MDAPFDPRAFARETEALANADGWTVHHLSETTSGPRPWMYRAAQSGTTAPNVYLSAGIHGDEISGPFALLELLRRPDFFRAFNTTIFPILNPNGMVKNLRENADGVDLNRDYRDTKSAEITSHIETLKTLGRFNAAMMLHEDYEGIGAYLFELNDALPQTLGNEIVAAMGRYLPIDLRSEIDEMPSQGGVISRRDIVALRGPIEERPEWPEAIYLSVNHTKVSYTTETPKPLALELRIKAQIAAIETLLESLLKSV